MAPTGFFMFLVLLVTAWLVSEWKRELGELLFVLAMVWVPTVLIALGARAVHRALFARGLRTRSMLIPWLALPLDLVVAYLFTIMLLSH